MFGLVETTVKRGKHGFTSAIVTGRRRIGKSMYGLQSVYQLKKRDGETDAYAWHYALNSVVFSLDDFKKKVARHSYKNRADAIIWDDAGVYGGSLLYLYNIDNAMWLKAMMDTIGTRVKLLILTCPNVGGLMRFLRNYDDFIVKVGIHVENGFDRQGIVLGPYMAKNMATRWRKLWNDKFKVKIPDYVYEEYVARRDKYADKIIKELMQRGEKGKKAIRETFGETD